MFIASVGGVATVARASAGVVRTLPETRALLVSAMEEVAALARSRGVRIGDDAVARALRLVDSMPPESTVSMQRDILAGRPSELIDQCGGVVRMAQEAGVAVPVHSCLYAALLPQEQTARRNAAARSTR